MAEPSLSSKELDVVIRSRSRTFFNGKVESITSSNATGIFDVLPTHANFITMVNDFVSINLPGGKSQKFKIRDGVMRVIENKVDVYLTV